MLSACRRSASPAGHSSSPGTTKRAAAAPASRSNTSTVTRAARWAVGSPSAPSMILAQAPSAPRFCTSSATAGSPPSIAHESIIRALRSDVITASTHLSPCRPRLLTAPHRQRNRELVAAWLVATRKISHAPGQPENLVDAASAEPSPVYCFVDGLQPVRQRQMAAQVCPRNFAIGLPAAAGQAPALPVTSLQYALGDHSRGFGALQRRLEIGLAQWQERLADVDAVAYRPRDLLRVPAHHRRRALAMSARSGCLTTRTGISGQDQLEACWVPRVHLATSEGDHARLQRRTKRLDDSQLELGCLIEK